MLLEGEPEGIVVFVLEIGRTSFNPPWEGEENPLIAQYCPVSKPKPIPL